MPVALGTADGDGDGFRQRRPFGEQFDLGGGRRATDGAMGADAAHQALGEDAQHSRSHEEARHAQVDQACDGSGRIIGVERAEDEVARLGRLDGDPGRFGVADLAHEDHVGILAQDGAQRLGEAEPRLLEDLHLVRSAQTVFDRVLRWW